MSSRLPLRTLLQVSLLGLPLWVGSSASAQAAPAALSPVFAAGHEAEWNLKRGTWKMGDGVLEQTDLEGLTVALLQAPALTDATITVDFRVQPAGPGVRAAAIAFRATGTMSYYWAHFDSRNGAVILVQSTPTESWHEIGRGSCPISADAWHTARVECRGDTVRVALDGKEVLTGKDATLKAGRIGLGTSQGQVQFRNLKIEGEVQAGAPALEDETPPPPLYKVISRGEAAGPYQAFPDACRLQNGDIVAVFYAGYGHVSLANAEWPKAGRIAMVRSSDEGRTWTPPAVLYDDEQDNRDPHIAQMKDGSVICSFFNYWKQDGKTVYASYITRSTDGGKTWEQKGTCISPEMWAASAPVRELSDGTYLLGVYREADGAAWGGVLRSTDKGKTWSAPIDIGKEAKQYLDAETDVIELKDGRVYAALRSSSVNMYCSTSADKGLTWAPATDMGFKGHAPHLTRLSTGEILMTHRVPATALHVSRDECKTWQGPYVLDQVGGAYPATVELKDGTVLAIYYTEGGGSHVRAQRFRLKADGIDLLPLD
jgi:sialidase-1